MFVTEAADIVCGAKVFMWQILIVMYSKIAPHDKQCTTVVMWSNLSLLHFDKFGSTWKTYNVLNNVQFINHLDHIPSEGVLGGRCAEGNHWQRGKWGSGGKKEEEEKGRSGKRGWKGVRVRRSWTSLRVWGNWSRWGSWTRRHQSATGASFSRKAKLPHLLYSSKVNMKVWGLMTSVMFIIKVFQSISRYLQVRSISQQADSE